MIKSNPSGDYPQVDKDACVDESALIIGKVRIGKNVFIAPGAVIRADEQGSSIIIKANCNVQDRVVVHALSKSRVIIDEGTSLSHGCIVHGPAKIGKNCFIGFGSVVFRARLGNGVVIKHLAVVEGIKIPQNRLVESHKTITNQEDLKDLGFVSKEMKAFTRMVVKANLKLVRGYKRLTGKSRMSLRNYIDKGQEL